MRDPARLERRRFASALRCGARAALAAVLWLSPVVAAVAQSGNSPAEIEAALVRFASQIVELEQQLEREPDHPTAWLMLIQLRGMERGVRMRYEGRDSTVEESLEFARSQYREWMAAQPWNGKAYIGYIASFPVEERPELVARFTAEVRHSAELLEWGLWTLKHAGESELASGIAERYLADNPGDGAVYQKVHNHFAQLGQRTRAGEVLARWLDALPGDGMALSFWYAAESRGQAGPAGRRAVAEEALARFTPAAGGSPLCDAIRYFEDLALDCYARLLGADLQRPEEERVLASMAELTGTSGAAGDVDALLARLPAEQRARTLLNLSMSAARRRDCAEALAWAKGAPLDSSTGGLAVAVLLRHCADRAAERARVEALLPRLGEEALPTLLTNLPEDRPFATIEDEVRRRLASGGASRQLWISLDGLYRRAGMTEARLEHLRAWSEAAEPGTFRRYGEWADLLLEAGRYEEALALLERVTRQGGPGDEVRLLEKLALLYLADSRFDDTAELVRRVRQREGADRRSTRGDLLLARLSWATGDVAEAEAAYRRHLQRNATVLGKAERDEALREYAVLAISAGHEGELLELLEESYRELRRQPNQTISGSLESWVAERLEAVEHFEPALGYLERALDSEPGNLELLERLAAAALVLDEFDRAERALRVLLEADPENPANWTRLAGLYLDSERPGQARRLLASAPQRTRLQAPGIDLALAGIYAAEGDWFGAIRQLRAARERWHSSRAVRDRLSEAYRRLAEAEDEAAAEAVAEESGP